MKRKNHLLCCLLSSKTYLLSSIAVYIIFSVVSNLFSQYMGSSVDVAASGSKVFQQYAVVLIIITLSDIFLNFIYKTLEARYMQQTLKRQRSTLMDGILSQPVSKYYKNGDAHYISALINDQSFLENNYLKPCIQIVQSIIMIVVSVIFMARISLIAVIFVLAASVLPIAIPNLFMKSLNAKMAQYSSSLKNYSLSLNDYLAGYETIVHYNKQEIFRKKHLEASNQLGRDRRRAYAFLDYVINTAAVSSILITIGILIVGMFLSIYGYLTIGQVFALSFISNGISGPMSNLSGNIPKVKAARPFIDKYNQMVDKPQSYPAIPEIKKGIELRNVSISFGRPVLRNIHFLFPKNAKIAVVGASGSGKSTILKLILGFFPDYSGDIYFDTNLLSQYNPTSIFNHITCVSQKPMIIYGSLRDNLTMFDRSVQDIDIQRALDMVVLRDKVEELKDGLNTFIEEDGNNLSGGEKQRLNLARALIRGCKFYILDEATSALDYHLYADIERKILSQPETTVISVTHRLDKNILSLYDCILVIKNGEVNGYAPYDQLLSENEYFRELIQSQETMGGVND